MIKSRIISLEKKMFSVQKPSFQFDSIPTLLDLEIIENMTEQEILFHRNEFNRKTALNINYLPNLFEFECL